jgi:hypothetical protein
MSVLAKSEKNLSGQFMWKEWKILTPTRRWDERTVILTPTTYSIAGTRNQRLEVVMTGREGLVLGLH